MKNFYLNTKNINEDLKKVATACNGSLRIDSNSAVLHFDSTEVKGTIKMDYFFNSTTVTSVSIIFKDDIQLSIESFSKSTVAFIYCNSGTIRHSIGISEKKNTLKAHHSGIINNQKSTNSILYFEKNTPYDFNLISVTKPDSLSVSKNYLINEIEETFLHSSKGYSKQSIQNLEISALLQKFGEIKNFGMKNHLQKKEIIASILQKELYLNKDSLLKLGLKIDQIRKKQIKKLKNIRSSIKNFSIENLFTKIIIETKNV